jgi:asparagine synthase (glutamine-hydrolysing)
MCGIFGYFGNSTGMPSQQNSIAALATLGHRGPDANGLYWRQDQGLVLGHTRLSIIDPGERSDQPFEHFSNILVFNGEIYNFRELRQELLVLGAEFRTSSDTEVIAVGYQYWGSSIFGRLLGMYAIALYDGRVNCLHLARDDFGIKPLCMLQRGSEIIFASEIKAIAALRSLSINGGILTDMLSWGFQMENASLYAGVNYLAPGTMLTFYRNDSGSLKMVQHQNRLANDTYDKPGNEPTAMDLREVIEASVRDHMIADVPVAVALSGGLDSSIVAAAAAAHHPGIQAYTFTLSSGKDPEVEHAALLCRHLGLEHRIAHIVSGELDGWLRRVAWHLEEPITNINALLSYGLAALIRAQGFKVVLVGEGADEVFGGYPWYRFALDIKRMGGPSGAFHAYRKRRAQSGCVRVLRPAAVVLAETRLQAQHQHFVSRLEQYAHSPLDGFLSFDRETQLQYSQLLRVDRMFMAHGVEARVPFLYRTVLEASAALPAARKMRAIGSEGRLEKVALAQAFSGILPERVVNRPKFGEQGTVNIWDTWLSDALTSEFRRCVDGAEFLGARQLLDEFIDWQAVTSQPLAHKEKFAIALLLETVDSLLLSRVNPDISLPIQWEML